MLSKFISKVISIKDIDGVIFVTFKLMGWFDKTPSIEDKFFYSLRDSDGTWSIDDSSYSIRMILFLKDDGQSFVFQKDTNWSTPKYKQIIKPNGSESVCHLNPLLYVRLESLAEERVLLQETERAGGYILDDDLRQAISNTKKVLNAGEQIEILTEYVKAIRSKYPTTNSTGSKSLTS